MAKLGMYEALPGLYFSGSPTLKKIEEFNIDAVVTVSTKKPPANVLAAVPTWHYLPLPDGKYVPHTAFLAAAHVAYEELLQGRRVLVHCLAGRTRSAAVCALVLAAHGLMSGANALHQVRGVRPGAVANAGIEHWLETLSSVKMV